VNVLVLQVFVSLMLVVGAVVLFAYSVKQADHEHADRLSLFPLEEDGAPDAPETAPAPDRPRDSE
jgi:hypothetical protein